MTQEAAGGRNPDPVGPAQRAFRLDAALALAAASLALLVWWAVSLWRTTRFG